MSMLFTFLFTCLVEFGLSVYDYAFFPNARVSVVPFMRFSQILMHEVLYTDSQDMLVLSFTIVSHYYNCSTDGSTSPSRKLWIPLVQTNKYKKTIAFLQKSIALFRNIPL
jgi:hypothetical protein